MGIIDAARAVLIVRSNETEVRREIAALLGSLDGNLSNEQVLERLEACESRRFAFSTMITDRPNKNPEAGKLKQWLQSLFKMRSSSENANRGT